MSQLNLTPPPADSSRMSELCDLYTYHLIDLGNVRRLIAFFGNHIPSHGWYTSTSPVYPVGSVHFSTASNSVPAINPVSDSTFNHPIASVEILLANPTFQLVLPKKLSSFPAHAGASPAISVDSVDSANSSMLNHSAHSIKSTNLSIYNHPVGCVHSVDPSIPNPSLNLTSNGGSAYALHLLQPKNNLETLPDVDPVHFFDLSPTSNKPNPTNPENCQAPDYSTRLEVKMRKAF
jgi:hypothetical protein